MKRLFDFIAAVAALILLSPVMLMIALIIKAGSPGPILYKGKRTGRNGIPFYMYKFRTMVSNAEQIGGTSTADTDPRITKVGHNLRKYKLDELPQFFNIIKGDMSFVGPRPEVEEYTRLYSDEEMKILSVRPGITDYSSIHFRNLNTILAASADPDLYYKDYIRPEKNKLRLLYVKDASLWVDFKIIIRTLLAVIFK